VENPEQPHIDEDENEADPAEESPLVKAEADEGNKAA
jgi:hypothetical protein